MYDYNQVTNLLLYKLNSGEITLEEALATNDIAYDKFITENTIVDNNFMISDLKLYDTNRDFDKIINTKPNNYFESSNGDSSIIKSIKKLIRKCINYVTDLRNKIVKKIKDRKIDKEFENYKKQFEFEKRSGKTKFKSIRYDECLKTLSTEVKLLNKLIDDFCKRYVKGMKQSEALKYKKNADKIIDSSNKKISMLTSKYEEVNASEMAKQIAVAEGMIKMSGSSSLSGYLNTLRATLDKSYAIIEDIDFEAKEYMEDSYYLDTTKSFKDVLNLVTREMSKHTWAILTVIDVGISKLYKGPHKFVVKNAAKVAAAGTGVGAVNQEVTNAIDTANKIALNREYKKSERRYREDNLQMMKNRWEYIK